MWKWKVAAILMVIAGLGLGYFVYSTEVNPNSNYSFQLGLDLAGGSRLIYKADISEISQGNVGESMTALRNVIERRVNSFGVTEPRIQTEKTGVFSKDAETSRRLIVELPGMTDIEEAKKAIGKTPVLEFKLKKQEKELPADLKRNIGEISRQETATSSATTTPADRYDKYFEQTKLTGRFLKGAKVTFGGGRNVTNEPKVQLRFNSKGTKLFSKITREHTDEILGIFLDQHPISLPRIQEEIPNGKAVISGNFTPDSASKLARNLNFGALPVPIELISTKTTGPSLGAKATSAGVQAGLWGLLAVALFMMMWYRLPGITAVLSLAFYIILMLVIFKLIPITLTTAAMAGFILSIGMAVDANVLIFERLKEELRKGKPTREAVEEGFKWAWPSIRDGKFSTLMIAIILFWLGRSFVEGFAFTLSIGVLLSMLTAIFVTKAFLLSITPQEGKKSRRFFGCGVKK